MTLACREGHLDIVRRLLAAGDKLSQRGPGKATVLLLAVESGSLDLLRLLLEQGAKPDLKDGNGYPPLCLAALYGNLEMFALLLEAGADPGFQTRDGNTAISALICSSKRIEIPKSEAFSGKYIGVQWTSNKVFAQAYLDEELVLPVLQKLVQRGAPVENDGPFSPLSHAAQSGRAGLVKLLLDSGADPNRRSPTTGDTALDVARMFKNPETIRLLEAVTRAGDRPPSPDFRRVPLGSPGKTRVSAAFPGR